MITVRVDNEAFLKEFRARVLRSRRTLSEVTNEVAFQILRRWQNLIPKANRAQIEALGITYRTLNKAGTKALKRKKALYTPTSAFKLIALKSMWQRGPSPRSFGNAAALDTAIAQKLARRNSSVGFVASGPVPAMRILMRKIRGKSLNGPENRSFKGTKGGAVAALDTWSPFAEVENATGFNTPGQSNESANRVYDGLVNTYNQAVNDITEEMASFAETELSKAMNGEN